MSHSVRQLQPLYRAIMDALSTRGGYFLKPELFTLAPFEPEAGMDMDGLPLLRVQPQPVNAANTEARNLAIELEGEFMRQLEHIAIRNGLEMEFPEDIWMIAAKDTATLRTGMELLAKELGVTTSRAR